MTGLRSVLVVDAVRTPLGRHGGALANVRPDDLAAHTITALMDRVDLDPARVDDVVFGNSNGAGEENRNVARMAWLLAGQPVSVPGTSVNRLCGSGLEAVIQASRAIAVGDADVCVAGGVESMTRAPWVLAKPERPFAREDATLHSTTLGWRMVNPRMPSEWAVSLGEGAELLADRYGITRDDQDALAVESHRRAARTWEEGAFDAEVVPVVENENMTLARDEGIRPDTTAEGLARLPTVFRPSGTVTAGNASQLSDGAAAAMLIDEGTVGSHDMTPLARIASRAVSAVEPQLYGIGPVEAAQVALKRAGIGWQDLEAVELNEAFGAQVLACLREWPDLDPSRVNPQGGAIALGHPIGCSGARLLATLAWRLRRLGGGYGLAAMCIGVGQGIAVVLEA
jgi:acetyl-CoA acetyltransferase family protein